MMTTRERGVGLESENDSVPEVGRGKELRPKLRKKIPNPKSQIPNKSQNPTFKNGAASRKERGRPRPRIATLEKADPGTRPSPLLSPRFLNCPSSFRI